MISELREGKYLVCRICGLTPMTYIREQPATWRCWKHQNRNPCAIEGCTRSTAVESDSRYADDGWMCSVHWRRYVPPRSARRRAYHAIWREAKRYGWTKERIARFHRFWDTLVASARARDAAGTVDVAQINRIMGWDD